jgi:membrane associated rhomboid family serine protease
MIFPISHDRDTLTRWPVVTLSLVGLCLAVHVMVELAEDPFELQQEALYYYFEHPYLEPDPEIWGGEIPELGGGVRLKDLFQGADQPTSSQLREEQRELDELTSAWLAVRGEQPFLRWGLIPADYAWYQLITYQFLHAGWLHLLGNVFLLYFAGAPLEDRWGRPVTLIFFLASGAVAALVYSSFYPESTVPLVGASGGVAGVFGACAVRFWNTTIRFAYFFFIIFRVYTGTFRAPAWLMLPIWFLGEIYSSYVSHEMRAALPGGSGVAYLAHVGGFGFGLALALVIKFTGGDRYLKSAIHEKIGLEENTALDEAYQARALGDPWGAREIVLQKLAEDPTQRDLIEAYWDASVEIKEPEPAAPKLLWLIQQELREGEVGLGLQHWAEIETYAPEVAVPPATRLLVAEAMLKRQRAGEARPVIRGLDPAAMATVAPMIVRRILDVARKADPASALTLARAAKANQALDPEQRAELEARVQAFESESEAFAAEGAGPVPHASPDMASPDMASPDMASPDMAPLNMEAGTLVATPGIPLRMDDQSLWLQLPGKPSARLGLSLIRALGAAHVSDDGSGFYLLDLVLTLPSGGGADGKAIRCRTGLWDPTSLTPGETDTVRALLAVVTRIEASSRCRVLPAKLDPFKPQPFASFAAIEDYERELTSRLLALRDAARGHASG